MLVCKWRRIRPTYVHKGVRLSSQHFVDTLLRIKLTEIGSGSALWSHPSWAFSSASSSSSLTGSQPSSSTNRLSDRSVGGGGFCEGRRSKADMRETLALIVPTGREAEGGGTLAEACVGGCAVSGRGAGASAAATLVLRDVASSRGALFAGADLRPFFVFWAGLLPLSPTVMMRNSQDNASPA